jgi:hypothetical protein
MEQMAQDFLQKMNTPADGLTLEDVKNRHEPHGRLIGCAYFAHSNGMMFNSNTLLDTSLMLVDGEQQISSTVKAAFQPTIKTVYRLKQDALAVVQALVEQENLAAWSALKYHNMFQCTDYSSSAKISLDFDDRSVGGAPRVYVSIDVDAACQHGGGDVITRFRELLDDAVKDAEVISSETGENPSGFMMGMGMMGVSAPPPAGSWKCKSCGKEGNTSKFCPECGTRRETE